MNWLTVKYALNVVSAGCHINDVMNCFPNRLTSLCVSAGCHINDVMNQCFRMRESHTVSAGCHINDVMNTAKNG